MPHKNNAYFLVNFIFVLIIGVVFCYSYFFYPNNQPIVCQIKELTGKDCPSCGLSRAFSAFTHFEWSNGKAYNPNAFGVFIFFVTQFILRVSLMCYVIITKKSISNTFTFFEIGLTIVFFLFTFYKFLV